MTNNTATEYAALIGLDWGDQSHAIALEPIGSPTETLTLQHSAESLHQWLDLIEQRFAGHQVAVAIETDRGPVVYALVERPWITIYPIHPATSTRHRTMFRPSGAADDLPDALVLLSLLQHHRDRLRPLHREDESTRKLANLVEARRKAVDRRTLLSNQLRSTLKDYFPQALALVGEDLSAPMALDFLKKWPRLTDAKMAKSLTLKTFYQRHNLRRPELAQNRLDLIRSARLLTRDAAVIEVSVRIVLMLVAELRVLAEHITEFEDAIAEAFLEHPEHGFFRELPGAGPTLAPRLLAAFGTTRDLYPEASSILRRGSGNREERFTGLDSLAMECAYFHSADVGRVGRPNRDLLSLGKGLLRATTSQEDGSSVHSTRSSIQMATRLVAMLANEAGL